MVQNNMRYLFFLLLAGLFISDASASDNLQHEDLSRLATLAGEEKLPILLVVSQHHCPFCVKLRKEIIKPMLIGGGDKNKVFITEIFLDSSKKITDFHGKLVRPGEIAENYQVWVTPTLLFLDYEGKEVHKRMLGVNTIEMYSYYLEESLDAALSAIRKGGESYVPTETDVLGSAPGADQL